MIEIGTLDRITVMVGEKGVGKSTLAKRDSEDFQRETGGLVIGHSPNGQIGYGDRIAFASTMRELEKGIRRRPDLQWFLTRGDPQEVIDYGTALSLALRKRAHDRVNATRPLFDRIRWREDRPPPFPIDATPVLVVVDEGTSMRRHPTDSEIEALEQLLTSTRHKHLALTFLTQAPTKRLWVTMEQATRFRLFRYTHQWGGNAIRAAGVPQAVVEELPTLPNFVYYASEKIDPHSGRWERLSKE